MTYITGASGFIGQHLLTKLGKDVVKVNYQDLPTFKPKPFDSFFFLSTYGNMSTHKENGMIWQANVIDLLTTLNKIVKMNFKSFVYVSSSSVKLKTQTMYSRSKKAAEEILLSYMEKYKLPITVIQPYSVTGVGEQAAHLIPTLIRSCMEQKLINFVPSPSHDYIDVSDVVDGMLNLSQHSAKGIFELGNGQCFTNQEVLTLVEKVTGKKALINEVDSMRAYDNNHWVSMNYRARMYGWIPKKSLTESITEMVEEYKRT